MKQTPKPIAKTVKKQQEQPAAAEVTARPGRFHLRVVTEEERELYRVPSYGYIL